MQYRSVNDQQKQKIGQSPGTVPGDWEGDLIAGSGNSFIATLVERKTRYVMLAKVGNKDSHSVIQALIKQARKLPKELYRSLTWDRGCEMAGHKVQPPFQTCAAADHYPGTDHDGF